MRRALIAAVGLAGIIGGLLTATPAAAAPSYAVSLAPVAAKADVGQRIRITGAVRGTGSAGKAVVLQRRVGTGGWQNIATTRTTKRSAFAFSHVIGTAGVQAFRVYAPRSRTVRAGISPARQLTGWRWLNLAEQPWRASNSGNAWVETGTFSLGADPGRTFPKSVSLGPESGATARFQVEFQPECTRLVTRMGWGRRSTSGTTATGAVSVNGVDAVNTTVSETTSIPVDVNPAGRIEFRASDASGSFPYVILVTPRVYCSVNSLVPFLEMAT